MKRSSPNKIREGNIFVVTSFNTFGFSQIQRLFQGKSVFRGLFLLESAAAAGAGLFRV
jgi:hypothetical protein